MKSKKIFFLLLVFIMSSQLLAPNLRLRAQDSEKLVSLSKQIIEAKTNAELEQLFAELKNLYFADNKYNELTEFLKSLSSKKKALEPFADYYIALSRYHQLNYLEEKQSWDEYFSHVNTYRDEITDFARATTDAVEPQEKLYIYAKLLLWQFHRDQLDAFHETALTDLMNSVLEYARASADPGPIKEAADKIFSYGEKGKAREIYKVYIDKLISSDIKDEDLAKTAAGFYQEANPELAEIIYDIYIPRVIISSKEKALPVLASIAKDFSYKDTGLKDEAYAESIFKRMEDLAGKEAFDEGLIHLRAFNLEKMKEYIKAKDYYEELTRRFPQGKYSGRAYYKAGIIYAYILRDIKTGRQYFKELTRQEALSDYGILSLYQLGLLSQWQEDYVKAGEYYNRIIGQAKDGEFPETRQLTLERLEEIEQHRPIEYNLKAFLAILSDEEYASFDGTKIDLISSAYLPKAGQAINIVSKTHNAENGCLQVELQYLWSGDLGQTRPSPQSASFNTTYTQPGTKVINLVVVSPAGIIGRYFDIVDVD